MPATIPPILQSLSGSMYALSAASLGAYKSLSVNAAGTAWEVGASNLPGVYEVFEGAPLFTFTHQDSPIQFVTPDATEEGENGMGVVWVLGKGGPGGDVSAGEQGGSFTVTTGTGGDGAATFAGQPGGDYEFIAGDGGDGGELQSGGVGGGISFFTGNGGPGSVEGNGGNFTITLGTGAAGGIYTIKSGATNRFRINGTGIGFYTTTPVAKQTITGSRADPEAALKNLLAACASIGLFTNSTTAS